MIILLFVLLFLMSRFIMQNSEATKITLADVVDNVCPPHKWRHVEVKDREGNTVRWRMVCDICGPLKPLDAPKKMDY